MAQSTLTVTPPSPTPPTNFATTGATPPNPPNFTKNTMNDPKNWSWVNPKDFAPPYFDDGAAQSLVLFNANTAALASGSGATAGGGENTYPGIGGLTPPAPNMGGAVPASTSVASEGAGTETLFTQTYSSAIYNPAGALLATGDLGNFVGVGTVAGLGNSANQMHASSLSPPTTTLTSLGTNNTASGGGTVSQTVTGVGFTRQSVIWVNGVAQATTFTNSTTIVAAAVTKKLTAGTWPVVVITAGTVTTAALTWTFT
jgi:hypothetical protein